MISLYTCVVGHNTIQYNMIHMIKKINIYVNKFRFGWLDGAPSIQHSLRLKRHKNGAQRSVRVFPFMSVTARRSVDTCDDKVVSEYEED